jgi:hypothetical protein
MPLRFLLAALAALLLVLGVLYLGLLFISGDLFTSKEEARLEVLS